jgi:hypothetical protein
MYQTIELVLNILQRFQFLFIDNWEIFMPGSQLYRKLIHPIMHADFVLTGQCNRSDRPGVSMVGKA